MVRYRIDPFDLRLFSAAIERGSIAAAAEAVHLSATAASDRLRALEHALGVSLLVRSKRGVQATDAGRALLTYSGRVLRELDSLYSEMAPFASGVRGTVRLLANTSATYQLLPQILGRFLAEHPDIDVDLQELWSYEILEKLREHRADVGIVADTVDTSGLAVQEFCDDELVLIRAKSGVEKDSSSSIAFADILGEPFVGLSRQSGLSRFLQDQASHCGKTIHHRVRVKSFDAVTQLVQWGVGMAVVPGSLVRRSPNPALEVVGLSDTWAARRLLICTPVDAEPSAHVKALLNALEAHHT
jgi:molybdate transport repressor ModE-like protein